MVSQYSKLLAIITAFFAFSSVAATTYQVTNNSSMKIGVDFYYYSEILKSDSILAGQTESITTPDNTNFVNIRPMPEGLWSGPVIRFEASKIQNNAFVVTSVQLSSNKIRLEVRSSGVLIGSGEFVKRLRY